MKKIILSLIISTLFACGNNNISNPNTNTESNADTTIVDTSSYVDTTLTTKDTIDLNNVLSLGIQRALKKEAFVCGDMADSVDIDVGCLLKSGNYYFILNNNTDYELTDITINSSNPAYNVTPEAITSIGVVGKSTGITPMIRVAINHGTPLNDMGTPDALQKGTAKTEVTISGKVNGQEFSQTYIIGGYAKTIEVVNINDEYFMVGPVRNINGEIQDSVQILLDNNLCLNEPSKLCAGEFNGVLTVWGHNFERLAPLAKGYTEKDDGIFTLSID